MEMVTALILINVDRNKVYEVAQGLLGIEGVSEVFSVAGQYDLVAVLRTTSNEQLADVVTSKLRTLPNILRTETLIAFRAFNQSDLGAMFSIGGDESPK